ncbi:heme A synthase [Lacinutrix sp. 5H-3-7-4]|uniref:COX15/CtaA family protein n=1 Tax=Lacinutrix sp. (strain 5H-3-7-4) TaxID=983544 RepID=UPI00020A3AC1|nr:COX15/CtaA family protein [Lacinutrix sp. 5H-3-7-4]AEH00082.1 cytochrome oxidase assembly [Lacinutrix sp. 5H-3-7-4]
MKKHFRTFAKIALVLVYLVIIAGAVVRMTGSGMGCPDWPKCFGYYIPPTQASDLEFKPNHDYKKGIVIIKDEGLLVAQTNFISSENIDLNNWEAYTKHDYAKYNPLHTWVEYINRLCGALSGIPILIFTVLSFWFWRKNKWLPIISILTVFGMAFQAWLGKTVVDSNLAPYKITIHMVMALVIVGFILYLIYASKTRFKKQIQNSKFKNILLFAIVLTLIQIVLGTQVRQHVDEQVKAIGYVKELWLQNPTLQFYVHRTFSFLVFFVNAWLYVKNKRLNLGYKKVNLIIICIVFEVVSGIAMYYFDFPFLSQPLHLVIATILFGIQFYVYLENSYKSIFISEEI